MRAKRFPENHSAQESFQTRQTAEKAGLLSQDAGTRAGQRHDARVQVPHGRGRKGVADQIGSFFLDRDLDELFCKLIAHAVGFAALMASFCVLQ